MYATARCHEACLVSLRCPHFGCWRHTSYLGYLLIPGPDAAPLPPAGAPLLGLMSCPESGGAEMEVGAPAAGTAAPGCPACPSPSMLASFPIASGLGLDGEKRWFWVVFTAGVKTRMKLSVAPLPPSSPTIQHPARSKRADGEAEGARWRNGWWLVARTYAFTWLNSTHPPLSTPYIRNKCHLLLKCIRYYIYDRLKKKDICFHSHMRTHTTCPK